MATEHHPDTSIEFHFCHLASPAEWVESVGYLVTFVKLHIIIYHTFGGLSSGFLKKVIHIMRINLNKRRWRSDTRPVEDDVSIRHHLDSVWWVVDAALYLAYYAEGVTYILGCVREPP